MTLSALCSPTGVVASVTCIGTDIVMRVFGQMTDDEELEKAEEVLKVGGAIERIG
ncbi:16195_t:CDS:2 [Funneliformis geosporum]|nr:16195_t:CDS:2 [Funneliformis geosporum]